jgi:hypothetical protein
MNILSELKKQINQEEEGKEVSSFDSSGKESEVKDKRNQIEEEH